MNVTDTGPALEKLANCSTTVRLWFLHNDLQLNADKSEVVIIGTAPQLRSAANIREVKVAGSRLQVPPKLKSLGITIDSHLRFDCHAKEVARACKYHTHALRHGGAAAGATGAMAPAKFWLGGPQCIWPLQ